MSERNPQIDYVIEQYALYSTPATLYRRMREQFGDDCFTAGVIRGMREKYRKEILDKRNELTTSIPILDVKERWGYLQDIIDGALEAEIVYDRMGIPVTAKIDRTVALNALKLANDLSTQQGVVNTEDDELIKSIVNEAFEELKASNPDKPDKEILDEIIASLGDRVKPYVKEMQQTLYVA